MLNSLFVTKDILGSIVFDWFDIALYLFINVCFARFTPCWNGMLSSTYGRLHCIGLLEVQGTMDLSKASAKSNQNINPFSLIDQETRPLSGSCNAYSSVRKHRNTFSSPIIESMGLHSSCPFNNNCCHVTNANVFNLRTIVLLVKG